MRSRRPENPKKYISGSVPPPQLVHVESKRHKRQSGDLFDGSEFNSSRYICCVQSSSAIQVCFLLEVFED